MFQSIFVRLMFEKNKKCINKQLYNNFKVEIIDFMRERESHDMIKEQNSCQFIFRFHSSEMQ